MYFFYVLTALGYRPTTYAMFVTVLQILQQVILRRATDSSNCSFSFLPF